MNVFNEFWAEKMRLDDLARNAGKPAAALTDVFPYLEVTLDRLESVPIEEKRTVSDTLPNEQRQFLLNAARGMAILAVRMNRAEHLRFGLLALLLEGGRSDSRETVSYLSLLNHSAGKIGGNLPTIFESLRGRALEDAGSLIARFLSKPESARSIDLFGFQEVHRSSGFDYKRVL